MDAGKKRKFFVDESFLEGIDIDKIQNTFSHKETCDEIILPMNQGSIISKSSLSRPSNYKLSSENANKIQNKAKNSPRTNKKNETTQKISPSNNEKEPLRVCYELVRDEPIPFFRVNWNSRTNIFNAFRSIVGKQTDSKNHVDFRLHKLDEVSKSLKKYCKERKFKLTLNGIPPFVENFFKDYKFDCSVKEKDNIMLKKLVEKLPLTIRNALRPFQKETLLSAFEKDGRILIGDEMGLGKTIQALALCALYKKEWPVLIISPSALKENWLFEFKKWLPEIISADKIKIISKNDFDGPDESQIYITSYNLASKLHEKLLKIKFDFIVLDECHMLKSKDTMRSKRIVPLAQKAKRRVLLSGTATPNRPIELYPQLQCLRPPKVKPKDWFMKRVDYSIRYCEGRREQKGRMLVWNEKGHSNLTELNIMLQRKAMIRRLKKDALPELKPKLRKIYRIFESLSPTPELLASYSKFDQSKVSEIFEGFFERASEDNLDGGAKLKLSFTSESSKKDFARLYKNTGLAKVKAVCAFLSRKMESGKKVIVFAHHKDVLDILENFLLRRECGFIRIDGRVPMEKRFEHVKAFQRFDYCRVALLSMSATGVGITLTSAQTVIFAELDFVPAKLLQCEDRAHRIGQTKTVKIYYILARKSLDDFVWPLIQRKLQTVSSTLDGIRKSSLKINSSTEFDANASVIKEKNFDRKIKGRQIEISFK